MLIVMRHGATPDEVQRVVAVIEELGYQARPMPGKQRTAVGLVGNDGRVDASRLAALPGVQEVIHVSKPYKQVSREWQQEATVVRLAGGKNIVVDSKVPLAAYLDAVEADAAEVPERLRAHARHLRTHVDQLAAKSYWAAFTPAPEFVVLFIPGEAFLAPALEHDSELLEYAMGRRVHIATPTTLISLLRTAQYAWQQEALSENAREVFDLGKQLHARLSTLGGHVEGLGRALNRTVGAYNQTVGSLESRVLVTARRFGELGLVDGDLDRLSGVTERPRTVAAPELTDSSPGLGVAPGLDTDSGLAGPTGPESDMSGAGVADAAHFGGIRHGSNSGNGSTQKAPQGINHGE